MFLKSVSYTCFVNDFDTNSRAWVPEIWAAETLVILEEFMVIGNLVHTDFADEIASFGDVVNTRRPGNFTAERKGLNDDVTIQDATAEKIAVPLNQYIHTSFMIRDGEESKSFKDLVTEYLAPAAKSLASMVDKILLGQVYQYLENSVGTLGGLDSTTAKGTILDVRKKMNENLADMSGRNLILTPNSETEVLKLDLFLSADKIGDDGTALREASLGRKLGFDIFMCQNTPSISAAGSTQRTANVNYLNADAAVGDTALTFDGGNLDDGQYFTLEGDEWPLYVASGGGTANIVSGRALRTAVTAAISDTFEYHGGLVDLAGHAGVTTYPAGYAKRIKVDTGGAPLDNASPQLGQLVRFYDTSGSALIAGEYSIVAIPATGYIVLDRPLDVAIENNDKVWMGPQGDYNFAFQRNALALVVRPLALPKAGTGALSGVSSFNGLSMRVTITYNGTQQGHLVTLDLLCGVKVLDTDMAAPMLG